MFKEDEMSLFYSFVHFCVNHLAGGTEVKQTEMEVLFQQAIGHQEKYHWESNN